MKVVLSRKGFDSSFGGIPSPILPNGEMISLPIPVEGENCTYEELQFPNGKSYAAILQQLNPKSDVPVNCHLDPDIRCNIRKTKPSGEWLPAFGQISAAQTHLENKGVSVGDLFLFFGWFKKTEYEAENLRFSKNAPDIQAIYGYFQIGEIVKGVDASRFPWHPHSNERYIYKKDGEISNNTIYLPTKTLMIDGEDFGLPGYGTLSYAEKRVLTADGMSRSKWKLNAAFENVALSYHSAGSIKDGYFQSAPKGQEFVFDEDKAVTNWVKSLLHKE